MKRLIVVLVVVVAGLAGGAYYNGRICVDDPAPRLAVEHYLRSLKENRFEDAYDFVTPSMTDGAGRKAWADSQRKMFEVGKVEIGELDVRASHRPKANVFFCEDRAIVPNMLRAKDRFNNQGSVEFELYTVVKDAGAWKLDSQETLFEEPRIREWFPNDEIPAFADQL